MNLVIDVTGKETIKATVESSTYCDPQMYISSQAIKPSTFIDYMDSKAGHHVQLCDLANY